MDGHDLDPSAQGGTESTHGLLGHRQSRRAGQEGGLPAPSPEMGREQWPVSRRRGTCLPAALGAPGIGVLPCPQPRPFPVFCRWVCQLLSKRQSSVTRRAGLSQLLEQFSNTELHGLH